MRLNMYNFFFNLIFAQNSVLLVADSLLDFSLAHAHSIPKKLLEQKINLSRCIEETNWFFYYQ